MFKFLTRIISTFFYVGYLPFIPGTFGSLAGILIILLVKNNLLTYLLTTTTLLALGFIFSGNLESLMQRKDPPCVVIDEVCGMLLSLLFLPYNIKLIFIAFLIFRILDTLKPFPARIAEKMKGSAGIMGDDIVAGIYTNIILQLVLIFTSFKAS